MILVSRPAPQLPRTLAALKRAGFRDLYPLPVADYENFTLETFPADATALILTSAAALTSLMRAIHTTGALEKRPGCLRFLPAYCVGAATARAARKAGLNVAYVGWSNAQAMANALVRQGLKRQTFLHLHADNAVTNWVTVLTEAGHAVAGLSAYQTAYLHALPVETVAKLQQKSPTHTLLFSLAGAKHLQALLKNSHIQPAGIAVALSPVVARAAKGFWPNVLVSRQTSLAGMVGILREGSTR